MGLAISSVRLLVEQALTFAGLNGRAAYIPLGELTTATEKARRDAPMIPVCEV